MKINMKWDYFRTLFIETHCSARALRSSTIMAYDAAIKRFRGYVRFNLEDKDPDAITAVDAMAYVKYLRKKCDNGDSAVNTQVTVLKQFYKAMVAMGHMEVSCNPMAYFPRMKKAPRKLPSWLSEEEVKRILDVPDTTTLIGVRDRAILFLIYGTGIRASECANLKERDVDFTNRSIFVIGKGSALKTDAYHAFPYIVENFADAAKQFNLRPCVRLYQIEGSLNGTAGRFEWIVDNGYITHRMFVPGGTVTGVPIKP